MAVWACDLNQANFRKAIVSDVEFTHTQPVVLSTIVVYQMTIQYLLKNWNNPERGRIAFEYAWQAAKQEHKVVATFMQVAFDLNEHAKNTGQDPFIAQIGNFNPKNNAGLIKYGFILANYFLLRHESHVSP